MVIFGAAVVPFAGIALALEMLIVLVVGVDAVEANVLLALAVERTVDVRAARRSR